MDLSTEYLGLTIENPIIVASSGLTKSADQIKKCEDAGAGAVVMKSLFEEQIRNEDSGLDESAMMHTEAFDYIRAEVDMLHGPRDYVEVIKEVKRSVTIPVIASINCYSAKWWISYAYELEAAGADALELNAYVLPFDSDKGSYAIENTYLEILQGVLEKIEIPISFKLSPYFTSFGNFAEKLDNQGVDGLVLFNRFIQPDIDLEKMENVLRPAFNDPVGFSHALRWVALLSGKLNLDIAASGNIRTAEDIAKQILAGASAVQIASVLYREGLGEIQSLLKDLKNWMDVKKFASIADIKGKLNQMNDPKSDTFVRAQYIKAFTGIE
ncbi:dihydroorotate dehydrogenase-like protein [candidate division KSB1 bacterium]|nr:dihydroorotate dehydrogenase-like protein [candidate division KSB1 bacterium]